MGVLNMMRSMITTNEWNIGVADVKLEELVGDDESPASNEVCPSVRWMPKPWFVRMQADPCLLEHDGRLYVYYERMSIASTKGQLRCGELTKGGGWACPGRPMIRLGHHASYPFVFRHLNVFYCVPETGRSNRVVLYESDAPAGPWVKHSVLLEGVSARDSSLFWFRDRWWLWCTVAGNGPHSSQSDLNIWHAPEPWGPWEAHRLRPVKTDIHSSRPAGRPYILNDTLYRPAQDCWPRYGARIVINRVVTVTPDDFAEEFCCSIEPDPKGPYREGLHTIATAGGLVMVDGCRSTVTLNPSSMAKAVLAEARKKLGGTSRYHPTT